MQEFGHYTLFISWSLALFGLITGFYAGAKRSASWERTTVYATILVGVSAGLALIMLGVSFVQDDYTNKYVWQFSNKDMPTIYKITAIWGGMDGSMLLWAFMLALSGAIVAVQSSSYRTSMMPWVLGVINSCSLFFLTIVVFLTNPFRYLNSPFIPNDGNGLNPLLQNEYMAIHPPTLYAGFTTFAIPYAFCIGALLANNLSNEWIRLTRRWTLIAWGFLTVGIVLGGHWAYIELGWGGFWAWDPVENASFLPWLTGTAFLHSVMVQERKSMLKMWNVWLIVLTFGLTVFGTFLTRSGVVQSVHAFASTDIGWVFLLYLGIIFASTLALTLYRRRELASERTIQSFLSREAFFLINNLLFLSLCFTITWGVLFPIISEGVTGMKQTVGIPFFNAVTIPMFLILIFLMGVGPLIAWQRASIKSIISTFSRPFISALVIAAILVWAGITEFYPTLSYALCWFVLMTIMGEFHRGMKIQRAASGESQGIIESASTLMRRHQTRYGGYIVHLGVVIVTLSITASMAHKVEKEFSLAVGETYKIGRFGITLDTLADAGTENYSALVAEATVTSAASGEKLAVLKPEMRRYKRNDESTSEVAIKMGPREDVYLVLAGLDDTGTKATMKVYINPLQMWLWVGAVIMVVGTVVVLVPRARLVTETSAASAETVRI